jgi:hypothetical protein
MFEKARLSGAVVFLLCVAACGAYLPVIADAQGIPKQIVPETCTGPNCDCGDLVQLASNILNTGIYIAIVLSAILFAWAGFQYLTNAANAEGKGHAKELIKNVIIGLVVILAAWLIVNTLMETLQVKLQGTFVARSH